MPPDITRSVTIDVNDKKVKVEVHVHLTSEEITLHIVPVVLALLKEHLQQLRINEELMKRQIG